MADLLAHKDLVVRYLKEIIEKRNLSLLDSIVHPDYFANPYYGEPSDFGPGIENLRNRLTKWISSFSEKFNILQLMENENSVFCEYQVTTKQLKPWFGYQPRDKISKVEGFALFTIKNGFIYKIKRHFDYDDFWSQLGHLVDQGQFELPMDLVTKVDFEKIKLNKNKGKDLERTFDTLQSSAIQYKDLLQYAKYVQLFFDISEKTMRTIAIQCVTEWQQKFSKHQSDLTGELPQELLRSTVWILEHGKDKLIELLVDSNDKSKVEKVFSNLIDFFAKEFTR